VRRFFDLADACGLRLPEDSQNLRLTLQDARDNWISNYEQGIAWPPRELWSLIALAQHYGVPTRLLDWSHHSLTAAYFAAHPSVCEPKHAYMAVWAYHRFPHALAQLSARASKVEFPFELITAPYADNPNLRAQRGLHFLLIQKQSLAPSDPAERYDLVQRLAVLGNPLPGTFPLLKFVLSTEHAAALVDKLDQRDVNAATLFPGYAGVVATMRDNMVVAKSIARRSHSGGN